MIFLLKTVWIPPRQAGRLNELARQSIRIHDLRALFVEKLEQRWSAHSQAPVRPQTFIEWNFYGVTLLFVTMW